MASLIWWKKKSMDPQWKQPRYYGNAAAFGRERRWNATAHAGVEEHKLFLRARFKRLKGREGRRDTLLPPLAPPLHQSIFTRTKMGNARILPTPLKRATIPPFSPLYSWEKLMDLNCISGEASRGQRAQSPNLAQWEEKWNSDFTERMDNPSLTVCRLSPPSLPPLKDINLSSDGSFSPGAPRCECSWRKTAAQVISFFNFSWKNFRIAFSFL